MFIRSEALPSHLLGWETCAGSQGGTSQPESCLAGGEEGHLSRPKAAKSSQKHAFRATWALGNGLKSTKNHDKSRVSEAQFEALAARSP